MQINLDADAFIPHIPVMKEDDTELWARFVRVSQAVVADVEAALKAEGFPPLAWYDALLELRRIGEDGCRQNALQSKMLLAQYNLSRLVDRLEKVGYVTRTPCPEDGRGQILRITEAGNDLLAEMWPAYRAAVQTRFAERLSVSQADGLSAALNWLAPE